MTEAQTTLDLLEKTPYEVAEKLLNHMATRKLEAFSRTNSGHEARNIEHLFWEIAQGRWIYKQHEGGYYTWKILSEKDALYYHNYYGANGGARETQRVGTMTYPGWRPKAGSQ